jgi:hypothetical protein
MERKMNDTVSAGLRSINEAKARMEGEMKLVLESLSRSEGFEKSVGQELGRIRAEIGRLDEKVKEAVAEEKGTLDRAISSELARLQKISREAEQKLGIMKDSWDRSMKESVRKNSEEFAKLRDFYAESMEKLDGMEKNMKAMVDNAVKDVVRRTSEDARTAASMRKEFESALREMKTTNRDSQEKLAMVKDFISNMETRFSTEIEALDRRVDGVSKTQRRLELDSLTPGKKGRQPVKKEDTD